ncbi:hypothetical protein [Clostridium sp. JN-1]|jgi:hypothetical protein|uniref:hypothetical protein n=1 Tax=Clostridium sp. JN-1 TaxID=2483110 RepID=UPI000F0B932D|nr:hypothetical protein [Clostridium sp. JN-1]
MGYNIIDLIDKAIDIANRERKIYEDIGKEHCSIPPIKIMSKVLITHVGKDIKYLEDLKNNLMNVEIEDIDFEIYDKMSFLINQFNKKVYVKKIVSTRDFLEFSLNFQRDVYSLLIDLQGRSVKSTNDVKTRTYKTLSNMINNAADHITVLEKTLK